MKSAYELALERLEKDRGPTRQLTDDQRARISEIESKCAAQIAENRLSYESRIAAAPFEEAEKLRQELAATIASLEATREREKEAIWNE